MEMLIDLLTGQLGGPDDLHRMAQVTRVVIAGNSVRKTASLDHCARPDCITKDWTDIGAHTKEAKRKSKWFRDSHDVKFGRAGRRAFLIEAYFFLLHYCWLQVEGGDTKKGGMTGDQGAAAVERVKEREREDGERIESRCLQCVK